MFKEAGNCKTVVNNVLANMLSYLFLLELLTEKADDDNCQKNKI